MSHIKSCLWGLIFYYYFKEINVTTEKPHKNDSKLDILGPLEQHVRFMQEAGLLQKQIQTSDTERYFVKAIGKKRYLQMLLSVFFKTKKEKIKALMCIEN